MDMDVVIRILMGGLLTAQSFLLANFCIKDCDKAAFWIWNVARRYVGDKCRHRTL